ncbi:MAG: malonic semialdehyde reductase [Deltaproteobacteria bacterium]|jgi:3-hydroxypropanoate dehydrogenase|nr:malonic semialdehyde reductase [Deltaproteobacteria bacterium]
MSQPLDPSARKIFAEARTYNEYEPKPLSDELVRELHGLFKWGPTAVNCQPGRFVFVRSPEAKKRLLPALSPGNVAKVESASATVIIGSDLKFYEELKVQWPAYDASGPYRGDAALAAATALRNSSLQGAYLILAARSLGLDCGPMSGFDNEKVDAEFFPGGQIRSNFLINLGWGREGAFYPRGPRLDFDRAVTIL